ncbi:MAG: hypothetical protein H0W07_03195 [Chloroflexi bacterium]|nr:hypothetical protein [Chloroflexota bacterium]
MTALVDPPLAIAAAGTVPGSVVVAQGLLALLGDRAGHRAYATFAVLSRTSRSG